MNRKSLTTILSLLLGLAAVVAVMAGMALKGPVQVVLAQVELVSLDTPYTQDFDTLAYTGTTSTWTNNSTLPGWYAQRETPTTTFPINVYRISYGSDTTGALYSFGITNTQERALGSIASGNTYTIYYGVRLRNNTNYAITALDVAYTGEQWRQGGNTSQHVLAFAYRVGDTVDDLIGGTWTSASALNFVSPITNSGAITGALNGNDPANRRELSATLNVLILPGQEIMLRWMDINDAGNDHGLAIDDLSVTPRSQPVLGITKNVTPTTDVAYHGFVTYTIRLGNIGGVSDTVLFTDTLPAEVDFGKWIEQPEGATVVGDVITWSGTVTAGTAITFAFTAQHVGNYGDVVTNTAEFSGTYDAGTAQAVFTVEKLTTNVTFVYHDLEDVVLVGGMTAETVCLRGDFNGWDCTLMDADPGNTVFSVTISGLEVGRTYEYKYYVNSTALGENSRWDMLNTNNRVLTMTSGVATVHDYRNVVVDWANLQWPYTLQTDVNKPTASVYGRVYIRNVTNLSGEGRGIRAQVGYGNSTDPAEWTWFPMTYNVDDGNNDEFRGVMTPTAGGVYSYATRFDGNWGPGNPNAGWTYGDTNGSPPFDLDKTGVLTVVVYDVALSKTAPTEPVVVRDGQGALVTYTLTVENRSTITPVASFTVTDVLPEGFVYVGNDSGVAPNGSGSAADPLVWEFTNPLSPGGSLSFRLVVSATDALTATGRYTDTAAVAVEGGDWIPGNDTAQAGVMVHRVIPIAQARGVPSGTLVTIEGTVTAEPGIFKDFGQNRKLYMQDGTGGVLVYLSTGLNPVARHNRVRVVGTMTEYRAETEIIPLSAADVVDLGPTTPVTPRHVDTGAIDESVEGQLVHITGWIVGKPADYRLQVNDGSGVVEVYRYYNLGQQGDPNYIDFSPYIVGDVISVTGVTRGYTETYGFTREVLPRGPADVKELYPTTFIYHDLEDVVRSGEAVYLAGSFNGWSTTATPINANADFSVFSVTVVLETSGTYEYKYVVYTDTVSGPPQWDWLQRPGSEGNRSVNVTAPYQVVDDYRNVAVGWAKLQWPPAITITLGQSTGDIYGRVYIHNVTNLPGEGRGIRAEVGYGTSANPAEWTWFPMTFNVDVDDGANDEFKGAFIPAAAGVYSYAVRFDGNWGPGNPSAGWTYGDLDGVHPTEPFELDQCGVLTVLAPSLSVAKSVSPQADVPPGGVVTYTVVLSNSGAGEALGVVLTDVLPAEVTFGGWVQQSGAVYENGVITWTGNLAGSTEVRLVFTATLNGDYNLYGQTVTNTARFASDNAGSGQASATFTVIGAPSLSVAKSVVPQADVPPGGVVTYTVVLSNSGAGDALGVVLTDALPAEVTFGGWVQQSGAVYENGVITWTGTVAGGTEVTLVFTATLGTDSGLYNRTVVNTARFVSDNAGSGSAQATFATARRYWVYLPLVMRNWRP